MRDAEREKTVAAFEDEAIERAESRLLKEINNAFIEQENGDFVLTDIAQDIFNIYLEEELNKWKIR